MVTMKKWWLVVLVFTCALSLTSCSKKKNTELLSGEPGIGKSTLIAQIAHSLKGEVFYASGEESAWQIKNRLERLRCNLSKIKFTKNNSPNFRIIYYDEKGG